MHQTQTTPRHALTTIVALCIAPYLAAADLSFRPLQEGDLQRLYEWVQQPHLAAWWGAPPESYATFVAELQEEIEASNFLAPIIVCLDAKPIGYVQYYCADERCRRFWSRRGKPTTGAVGLEVIIGERTHLGKGYCAQIINKFVQKIFTETTAEKIVADPCPDNCAAVRCYERVGFKKSSDPTSVPYVKTTSGHMVLMELTRQEWHRSQDATTSAL